VKPRTYRSPAPAASEAVEVGSGNVFADLGFPDATELDIKVHLAIEIVRLVNERKLSMVATATLLRIDRMTVFALKKYRLDRLSVRELMNFLTALVLDLSMCMRTSADRRRPGRILWDGDA
jgi:predicted XRE-type DNA-binding protein